MARPTLPIDGESPWTQKLRDGIYDVSDRVDTNTTALTTKADDSAVVKLTTNQTLAGTKTFSSPPVVPDGSFTEAKVAGLTTDLTAKAPLASPAFTGTPTGINKGHVGLGNVDNTSDTNKPISTATQTALDGKATLITVAQNEVPIRTSSGSGVTDSSKLVSEAAAVSTIAARASDGQLKAVTAVASDALVPLAQANSLISTAVGGLTKTSVGLANVDNTTDLNKPVSTAVTTALSTKATSAANAPGKFIGVLSAVPSSGSFSENDWCVVPA